MLDINLIREKPEEAREALLKRGIEVDFTELLERDGRRRALIVESDELKARRNRVSKEIAGLKREGKDAGSLVAQMREVGERIKYLDRSRTEVSEQIQHFLEVLPNIPAQDVPSGGKENNLLLHTWGQKRTFDFKPRDHVTLVELLGLVDYRRGAKLGGSGFWVYRDKGAVLEWALLCYFIDSHRADGYEFILPPHILNYSCGYTAGQFPKFVDDDFRLHQDGDSQNLQFLLPTSETALASLHMNEILREEELPRRYFSLTPCYRREAGSYRTHERGMIRGHQFNKVEMFQYVLPEKSGEALEELLEKAERLVQGLGLHYRVSKLAAADCGPAMAKTYDVEVWMPSMDDYLEVSSVSSARDYQARRGNIRVKRSSGGNEYLHTLNASGLATSRLFPALCEQLQQEDGSIPIPKVLLDRTGFDTIMPLAEPPL
jgi:seryl-tRNA synthetase